MIRVPVTINGGPASPEVKVLPKHKKNPEVGEKKTVYTSTILVEQEDALSFDDQEEVHLFPFPSHRICILTISLPSRSP
jgi:glutamyl-tRNA synthetase